MKREFTPKQLKIAKVEIDNDYNNDIKTVLKTENAGKFEKSIIKVETQNGETPSVYYLVRATNYEKNCFNFYDNQKSYSRLFDDETAAVKVFNDLVYRDLQTI